MQRRTHAGGRIDIIDERHQPCQNVVSRKERGQQLLHAWPDHVYGHGDGLGNHDVDLKRVAKTCLEIVNEVKNIPQITYSDTGFSTGVVNYYTIPKMCYINVHFIDSLVKGVNRIGAISLDERKKPVEDIAEILKADLQSAYDREA